MTVPEWISLTLRNASPKVLIITRVELSWGKLHAAGDQNRELAAQDVADTKIAPNEDYVLAACAHEDGSSQP
ncbi:hypothetical protein EWM64_g9939 [Hericium alpestre]|uniref:Uncharacterized protein n=1 Tax=Hericium alpestre TaxID=135208 RepID=A0A4Y9ZJK8_9AGAM|nr:hypothetical protein EWM64_g9939 [Hericium alpestre]